MRRFIKIASAVVSISCALSCFSITGADASLTESTRRSVNCDIPNSVAGKISYSETYNPVYWQKPRNDGRGGTGYDAWRDGLVTGNGENGLLEDCAPENDAMIFQNIRYGFPSNDQRETPELASVMDSAKQMLVNNGKPDAASSASASSVLLSRAGEWSRNNGLLASGSWHLMNTYAFHPGHQLRLRMNDLENGAETAYYRYTNYETAEIGTRWADEKGSWERKSFSSREDNVTISRISSQDGKTEFTLDLSVDDISDMSNEDAMSGNLDNLRYKKFYRQNGVNDAYIGQIMHYPNEANSELKDGGCGGLTRILVIGKNAQISVENGDTPQDDRTDEQKENGVPDETVINVSGSGTEGGDVTFDYDPTVHITNADAVILITKSERDTDMCEYDKFADMISYNLITSLSDATKAVAEKYSENGVFSYDKALEPHKEKHAAQYTAVTFDINASAEDRALTNEKLIAKQKENKTAVNPAMLERMFYNGRYAAVCCSGYQVPRLGGMWTGAYEVQWSGDYTTDANINLQSAGANIGALSSFSDGYINLLLRVLPDWEINAKQIYGISDAFFAPSRIDGDRAMMTHFSYNFPGDIWNAGASWLTIPIYEYWQCYGDQKIPLADDVREMLKNTENTYNMAGKSGDGADDGTVYNLRNALMLSDERVNEILEQGCFDLERDILYPLLKKTADFWTGYLTPEYYTKDGVPCYEEGKTELGEGETYLFTPSYSPENHPKGFGQTSCIHNNAYMDIAAARECLKEAQTIAAKIGQRTDDINTWQEYIDKFPPYYYEPTGEVKEWAIKSYGEHYEHRCISQLYGVWPGFESESNAELFEGAKKLIETKNKMQTGDCVAGHFWVHKGLAMARLKSGNGVEECLLPIMTNNMHYASMITSHDYTGTEAYCTDATITVPAILLEAAVYSDSEVMELAPALPDFMLDGGGKITGMRSRTGAVIDSLEWDSDSVKANITAEGTTRIKCGKAFSVVTVDGADKTSELKTDSTGESYIELSGSGEVEFTFAEPDTGTYFIERDGKNLAVTDTANGAAAAELTADGTAAQKWNVTRLEHDTYKLVSAYTGKALTYSEGAAVLKNYSGDDNQIWRYTDGKLVTKGGSELYAVTFIETDETETTVSADSITIASGHKKNIKTGDTFEIDVTTEPEKALGTGIDWIITGTGGASVDSDNVLTATKAGHITVQAKSKISGQLSGTLEYDIAQTPDAADLDMSKYSVMYCDNQSSTSGKIIKAPSTDYGAMLCDGDKTKALGNNRSSKVIFDFGKYGIDIKSVTLYANGAASSGDEFVAVSGAIDSETDMCEDTYAEGDTISYTPILRTNGSSQNGVTVTSNKWADEGVYSVGEAGKYRYLIVYRGGTNPSLISEIGVNGIDLDMSGEFVEGGSIDLSLASVKYSSHVNAVSGVIVPSNGTDYAAVLHDGLLSPTVGTNRNRKIIYDFGKYGVDIDEITFYGKGTAKDEFVAVSGAIGDDGICSDEYAEGDTIEFTPVLRTNGSVQNGIAVKENKWADKGRYTVGPVGKYRYVIFYKGGTAPSEATELVLNGTVLAPDFKLDYETDDSGEITLNISAAESVDVYIAVYNSDGSLRTVKAFNGISGDTAKQTGINIADGATIKAFMWREQASVLVATIIK